MLEARNTLDKNFLRAPKCK